MAISRKSEFAHQANVIAWCRQRHNRRRYMLDTDLDISLLDLIHAIPNAGKRTRWEGQRVRHEGIKRGVPDLSLPVPTERFTGLYIEMKAPGKGATLTPEQGWWQHVLTQTKHCSEVCAGAADALDLLQEYLEEYRSD